MTSSSGETFRAVWKGLSDEARNACRGVFSDRNCQALNVARELLGDKSVLESNKSEIEHIALGKLDPVDDANGMVLLCGYFGILSKGFLEACPFPIVNTHPSLLPSFSGLDKKVHARASENVGLSGFTVHLVTEVVDGGPILFQHPVWVDPKVPEDDVRAAVRAAEQKWLPLVWEQLLKSDIKVTDRHLTTRELRATKFLVPSTFVDQEFEHS